MTKYARVLAHSTQLENGFQKDLKTGVVFFDLTAVNDTVCHRGLLAKTSKCLKCLTPWVAIYRAISFLHQNRRLRVHLSDRTSRLKSFLKWILPKLYPGSRCSAFTSVSPRNLLEEIHLRQRHLLKSGSNWLLLKIASNLSSIYIMFRPRVNSTWDSTVNPTSPSRHHPQPHSVISQASHKYCSKGGPEGQHHRKTGRLRLGREWHYQHQPWFTHFSVEMKN